MYGQQKYIRVNQLGGGTDVIVLFPFIVGHNEMASGLNLKAENVISAGFIATGVKGGLMYARCHGKSTSLGLDSKSEDTELLVRQHYPYLVD